MNEEKSPPNLERERQRILGAYQHLCSGGDDYFLHEDEAHVLRLSQRYSATLRLLDAVMGRGIVRGKVLDVGCGEGIQLIEMLQWGFEPSNLAGIDLRPDVVERAQARLPAAVDLRVGCAGDLPWQAESFHLVSLHTVMSSVLDPNMRLAMAGEIDRVLLPGGALLWYDTRRQNPHNPHVLAVSVAEMQELFPSYQSHGHTLTFLPHIARRLPDLLLRLFYPLLAAFPPWRSHQLGLLVKP